MRRRVLLPLVSLLVACAPPTPTPAASVRASDQRVTASSAPSATRSPEPPGAGVPIARATFASPFTPTPTPAVPSRGLGLTRAEWTAQHPYGTALTVTAWVDGRVGAIHGEFTGTRVELEDARTLEVLPRLPSDARYLRTDRLADGRVADLFVSPALAEQLPSAPWRQPGTFAAVYEVDPQGRALRYDLVLGQP